MEVTKTPTKDLESLVWSDAAETDTSKATVACDVTYDDGKVIITFDQVVDIAKMRQTAGGNVFIALKGEQVELNIVKTLPDGETKERVMVTYPFAARLNFKLK